MRGSRVKALRRAFKADFGFNPPGARWVTERIRPKNWFQKVWWALRKHRPTHVVLYHSTWRRFKRAVKKADRAGQQA